MLPGDVVGDRFEVERVAGQGGMGVVYRARDRFTGGDVALKLLQAAVSEKARFAREARVLAMLPHPAIVRHVAHGETSDGSLYLAMEWLEGEDLYKRLGRRGLTLDESLALVSRVAEALGAAHARGIVHRDVKPSNVFLPDGDVARAKILDFGIARVSDRTQTATLTGLAIGTPGYMAPEQARGSPDVDARADVFALGCVLFECVTGHRAFPGSHAMAILAMVLFEEPPRLRELQPAASHALDDLVVAMLAKDPARRPRDGAEVAAALSRIEQDSGFDGVRPLVSAPVTALTGGERRRLSVVLARARHVATLEDATAKTLASSSSVLAEVRAVTAPFAAETEILVDGTIVAALTTPEVATDQAVRAARCAFALRDALPPSSVVIVTGRASFLGRAPIGEVVERGVDLLRAHRDAGIRLDDVTAGLLDARFDVVHEDSVVQLLREREGQERRRTVLGKPTPFAGRKRELAVLLGLFEECAAEPVARAALVSAPPGVGKSRLCEEFVSLVRDRAEVIVGRADPMRASVPLGMIGSAIRGLCGILEGEAAETRQRKLSARVGRHVEVSERARLVDLVSEMIGGKRAARDALSNADQMRQAFVDFLRAECTHHPVLFVLEDLHWGDLPSIEFLDAALRSLREQPLMVLALSRPEVHTTFSALWKDRDLQEIRLGPLGKNAAEAVVRAILGDVDTALVARIVERADGNAFSLEELVRAAADGKGDWFGESVVAMVDARLDALDAPARALLRAASLFGEVFWAGGVAALLGSDRDVDAWLGTLIEREWITPRSGGRFHGEREYAFRHALLREGAYARLTDGDRMLGHRLAASWLEAHGEQDALVIADHLVRGGGGERAIEWLVVAAEQALAVNDLASAIATAARAIELGAKGEGRGRARLVQSEANRLRGEWSDAQSNSVEALSLLRPGSTGAFHAAAEMAAAHLPLGDRMRIEQAAQALADALPEPGTEGVLLVAIAQVSVQLVQIGLYDAARRLVGDVLSRAEASDDHSARGWVARARAYDAAFQGDPARALGFARESVEAFERASDPRNSCISRANVGYYSLQVGCNDEAIAALGLAIEEAQRLGMHNVVAVAEGNLGVGLGRLGRWDEARRHIQIVVDAASKQGNRRALGLAHVYLATVSMRAGDLDAAARAAERATELLAVVPPLLSFALATLARVRAAMGRAEEALGDAEKAMELL
ncbi:MAG: protein kinase domain-containing protein, partial [Polyangiales bacterium]